MIKSTKFLIQMLSQRDYKTESVNLRVEKKVLDKLREEAHKDLKSINVLGKEHYTLYSLRESKYSRLAIS